MADISRADAEAFLYREARLIDERQFDDWLTLFTDDATYWLPIDENAGPQAHLSLIYDDAHRLKERVYRLTRTEFPAQSPPSHTVHFISNVEVVPRRGSDVVVHSNQIIFELRTGDLRRAASTGCGPRPRAGGSPGSAWCC
jgi:ethylbenzene dioxygenase subunit beta